MIQVYFSYGNHGTYSQSTMFVQQVSLKQVICTINRKYVQLRYHLYLWYIPGMHHTCSRSMIEKGDMYHKQTEFLDKVLPQPMVHNWYVLFNGPSESKRIELIKLMDLAWRPRGALSMVHVTKKKHPCDGKYRLLRNNKKYSHSKILFTLTFSRLKGIIKMNIEF